MSTEQKHENKSAEPPADAVTELDKLKAERDEMHANWLRAVADLDNYRKRSAKDLEEERKFRAMPVVRDLLPSLDNLRRTVAAAESATDVKGIVDGVQMVLQQVNTALGRHGVMVIESVGKPFDPNLHQAVQQMPSAEVPPMTVITEHEAGYLLHDRVIRPAMVVVSTAAAEQPTA
jgi:molecular chaperone GrpE